MLIYINDQPETIESPDTLLLDFINKHVYNYPKGIAVAVNGEIISRSLWNNYALKENDKVTLIQATQGG